jgi:hypothetical protein
MRYEKFYIISIKKLLLFKSYSYLMVQALYFKHGFLISNFKFQIS